MLAKRVGESDLSGDDEGWRSEEDLQEEVDEGDEGTFVDPADVAAADGRSADLDEVEDDTESSAFTFDDRWQNDFEGLLYIGHLEDTVEMMGHEFRIKTLTQREKLKISLLSKPYEQTTMGFLKAYRAACCAAGLLTVDGQPLFSAQKNVDSLQQKFNYVTENWHEPVIDLLYAKIDQLEGKSLEVMRDLGFFGEPEAAVEIFDEEGPDEPPLGP